MLTIVYKTQLGYFKLTDGNHVTKVRRWLAVRLNFFDPMIISVVCLATGHQKLCGSPLLTMRYGMVVPRLHAMFAVIVVASHSCSAVSRRRLLSNLRVSRCGFGREV